MDRRKFLFAGGTAFLGLAAAACTDKGKKPPSGGGSLDDLSKGKTQSLTPVVVQPLTGKPNERLSLGLVSALGSNKGQPFKGGTAKVWYAKSRTAKATGPVELVYHGSGFQFGVYVTRISLPTAGSWFFYVEAKPDGAASTLSGGSQEIVGNLPTAPGGKPQPSPGDKAISVPSPTVRSPRGVDPICTRTNGAGKHQICTMHTISLDTALKNGKPTVLTIGTPAFCQTRTCGPVVDQLMIVRNKLAAKVNFVHIELYKDDKDAPAKQLLAPAAAAWRIEAEPVVYYIKPDGVIADWTIGATDAPEIAQIAQSLL